MPARVLLSLREEEREREGGGGNLGGSFQGKSWPAANSVNWHWHLASGICLWYVVYLAHVI